MAHAYLYDDEIGLDYDDSPSRYFAGKWPVSEVLLSAALYSQRSLEGIAEDYEVSVAEVIELCETYGLDLG